MTAAVILLATLIALYLARKAYPEALGERFDLEGPALSERGAMAVAAGIGVFAFAGIVGAWLAVAPVSA
jgi:hypothetical protein